MRHSISEILALANSKKTNEERIDVLHQFDSFPLRHILRLCFQPDVKWLLPEGKMDYKIGSIIDQEGSLYSKATKLYLFLDGPSGGNPSLDQNRREALFIQYLEGLTANDAELLMNVKDKKMPFKKITEEVVLAAYPGLYS